MFADVSSERIAQALAESEGNVETFIAKLQEFASQDAEAEVTVTADTSQAEANVDGLYSDVEGGADGEVNIEDGSVIQSDEDVNQLGDDVTNMPDSKDISVNVNGNASDVLSDIYWYLTNMPTSKEVTVTTTRSRTPRAASTRSMQQAVASSSTALAASSRAARPFSVRTGTATSTSQARQAASG